MREIKLTHGKLALVDNSDFDIVSQYRWRYLGKGCVFAITTVDGHRTKIVMARLIMNCPSGWVVHHKNHDVLDNRQNNLCVCTRAENNFHKIKILRKCSSKYKGVYRSKGRIKWSASIQAYGIRVLIGQFDDELEAAQAYNKAATKYFGEFALLNEVI